MRYSSSKHFVKVILDFDLFIPDQRGYVFDNYHQRILILEMYGTCLDGNYFLWLFSLVFGIRKMFEAF
jgi:hypothetical protein